MLLVPLNTEETIVLDGISIEVDCRTLAGSANFEVRSPEPTTHAGRLVGLIYDIAWEASSVASAVERLEHLHGYLRDELPARIIDGPITRLRLFGSLATQHQEALRQLFARLLHNGPLLIDMTNFDGMGTALYGAFIEFAASRPHLAFATSPSSRRHLEAMQLSPERMYDRVEDAIRFLETSG
jgi:anti-anti-sigma regulatory factor